MNANSPRSAQDETAPQDARTLLDVRDLTISYGGSAPSVRGVGLTVSSGEILGLIGESGSGKSTVAMAALGLLPQTARISAERFEVCGVDVLGSSPQQLTALRGRRIAMVFQDAMGALDPCMRIGAQIGEVVKRHQGLSGARCREEVLNLMRQVGLPEPERRARQFPHQLSGGLRQRAAIAVALAGKPEILLADEPTTALDVTVQAGILTLFRSIRDELGVGIVLVSHDMGVIAQTADRVAVMLDGEIVEQGSVQQVLLSPSTDYARRLLDAAPDLDAAAQDRAPAAPPEGPAEVVLEAAHASKRYRSKGRQVVAVDDVSLQVHRGEVLGIVGESGSGKSTLAKLLVRLEDASTGDLRMNGVHYGQLKGALGRRIRGKIQMVFQHPAGSLNPRMKVGRSIREPLTVEGVSRPTADARVQELLREVGLPEESAQRLPHEFSGGQKQRIAIARAVSSSPEIVILDEPTSALDVSVQAQVLGLLDRVREQRDLTYVFISHNLSVVRAISDRVAVMYAGRLVEVGPGEEVFANAQHWYTRALVAAVPSTDPRHRDTDVADPEQVADPAAFELTAEQREHPACAFAPRCPMAMARCWSEVPDLVEVRPRQLVACHAPTSTAASAGSAASSAPERERELA
ncbi:dipeptide ABC transporter ATP-binding protein [Nocardioides nitrophenolicus]|uniref:dipeptide ABC transporter ATP-binding protein n=1 Tax=Nocardioides nitrophenolicus TaxID=60489 RepID=UPI001957775C|nr:ABC transporter ATP-binding protein [Nocardioides nitrophenolicus]MBM7517078.1 peptide/nickel transport system ATP-binding protein [Nocardioides nitrophenolicus]